MTMRIGSPRTLAGALWRQTSKPNGVETLTTSDVQPLSEIGPLPELTAVHDAPQSENTWTAPRPIFVIGSLRSGASMLAASLGQHPEIAPVLDTSWIERFVLGLQQTYHEDSLREDLSQFTALGIDHRRFFTHFGEAIDRLLLAQYGESPPRAGADTPLSWRSLTHGGAAGADKAYRPSRWVDSCYTHVFNVFALHQLFPDAQFFHVVRDVDEVVASLISPNSESLFKSRHVPFTAQDAYEHWLDAVTAGLEAERAFGTRTVQRVLRAEMIQNPEAVVRACLARLGEDYDDRCLRPFRAAEAGGEPVSATPGENVSDGVPAEIVEQAEFLSFALVTDAGSSCQRPPDYQRIERMKSTFTGRASNALLAQ